ncbi:phage tail protein [Salmonella enterica]
MIIGFGNNVVSSLAADITASQTTIQVMPGAGAMFANLLTSDYANSSNPLKTYAKITLTDAKETVFEVCHLTAVNNDMLTVIRGQEGTTAKGWSLNDVIANFATRGSENQFVQIEELQSGHYVAGVAGGTENNLTLELPATYFVNGGVDWTLRTPLVVIPALNNTGASTLQLTMGGRVLGIFPLYKGNKSELSASDIIKDVPVLCVLDNTKTYFSVLNPLEIYLGSRYLQKDQNGADVPDKLAFLQNVGAFPVTGGRLNGPLGIGTDNVLGGNSIVLGDNDTGIKWISDGILGLYANGTQVGYIDPAGLHLNSEGLHVGGARMSSDGNVWGTRWNASGQWLWDAIVEQLNTRGTIDWINSQLSERDNNINARAPRNTASLAVNGWFRDASTGWIFQWGITPFAGNTTITVSLPIPFPVQGFLALGGPASALWYGEDDNSSYAALLNNSQLQVTTDTNVGTAWIVMGH